MEKSAAGNELREIVERRRGGPRAAREDDGERLAAALEALAISRDSDASVVPFIVELWASGPESDVVRACHRHLGKLAQIWRGFRSLHHLAEALAERSSFARFGAGLDPALPRTSPHVELALLILMPLTTEAHDRTGRSTGRLEYPAAQSVLERREWVEAIAALRDHDFLGRVAYHALGRARPESIPPLPPPPPAARPRGDALSRYRAGEHVGAWQSISEAPRLDPDAREEARAVAVETMQIVRANAETIVEVLRAAGYPFAGEALGDSQRIAREGHELATTVGGPPPVSLEVFWEVVGAIDLCRSEEGDDCDLDVGESFLFRNPLQVQAPSVASWCVDRWKKDRAPAPWLALEISADALHKEWTSGGPGYWIRIPSERADGRVQSEPHELDFVPYLRLNFEHCGFLGYERHPFDQSYRRLVERVKARLAPF